MGVTSQILQTAFGGKTDRGALQDLADKAQAIFKPSAEAEFENTVREKLYFFIVFR